MRGPIGYLITPIGKAKKGLHVLRSPVFTDNIGEEQKKVFVVLVKAPRFLRGPPFSPMPCRLRTCSLASACS